MMFIRPWALVLILLWPLLIFVRCKVHADNPWRNVIDPKFLPYLMVKTSGKTVRRTGWLLGLLWMALCIAVAGPAVDKIPTESIVKASDTVIVADLSPAASGPVLAQLKVKLYELLKGVKGDNVGLVLYDTKGYVISPLTPDTAIIRDMIPALDPSILPEIAQEPVRGFEKAAALLGPDNSNGRIIFVTTGGFDEQPVAQLAKYLPYKIGVLGIGNATTGVPMVLPNGGFMQDSAGKPLLARADKDRLSTIGHYEFARPNGTEITALLNATKPNLTGDFDGEKSFLKADVWRDLGVYIVVICLPFLALLFRKGVFFAILLLWSLGTNASWFERPDQTAYKNEVAGVEAYRAGDYQKAAELWQQNAYNRGNALAYQGQYEQAIAAYADVLKNNPEHVDAAFNKKYLEDQLKQNNQQGGGGDKTNESDETQETETPPEQQGDKARNQSDSTDQLDGQADDESKPQTDSQQADTQSGNEELPVQPDPQQGAQTGVEQTESPTEPQGNQQTQQLFNAIKKDPSRVLRYRIYRQHQNYLR